MFVSDKMINILDEWIMEIPKIVVARGFYRIDIVVGQLLLQLRIRKNYIVREMLFLYAWPRILNDDASEQWSWLFVFSIESADIVDMRTFALTSFALNYVAMCIDYFTCWHKVSFVIAFSYIVCFSQNWYWQWIARLKMIGSVCVLCEHFCTIECRLRAHHAQNIISMEFSLFRAKCVSKWV